MFARLQVCVWLFVVCNWQITLAFTPSNPETVVSTDSTLEYWRRLYHEHIKYCPGTNICGIADSGHKNRTEPPSECCTSCSCGFSCNEGQNCCHGNEHSNVSQEPTRCMVAAQGNYDEINTHLTLYRFIVNYPQNGCVLETMHGTSGEERSVDSLTNFQPVYSRTMDLNFINEHIARCHGVVDIEEWIPTIVYDGDARTIAHTIDHFYTTLDTPDVFILFKPPTPESESLRHICYNVKGTCPDDYNNTFRIPSAEQMDIPSIVKACNEGPRALYLSSVTNAFKNVFCAICNGIAPYNDKLMCVLSKDGYGKGYVSLLSGEIDINTLKLSKKSTKESIPNCYQNTGVVSNASECAMLHCPSFQIRTADNKCVYPIGTFKIDCKSVSLSLNLSTTERLDRSVILNIEPQRLLSLLEQHSPWAGCLYILRIAVRIDIDRAEMRLIIGCTIQHVYIRTMVKYIRNQLDQKWPVSIGGGKMVYFKQHLSKHGGLDDAKPFGNTTTYSVPLWSLYIGDQKEPQKPVWQLVYKSLSKRHEHCLEVTKLFFCEQIEIRNSEFNVLSLYSIYARYKIPVLFLRHTKRLLFPNEYMLSVNESSSRLVRVCLEDSGYAPVVSAASDKGVHVLRLVACFVIVPFMDVYL